MSAKHEPSLGQPVPIVNLDLIGVGVLQIGVDAENTFRIEAANRRAADLIGLKNPHLPQTIEQVLPGEMIGKLVPGLRDCGHTGREIELEVLHQKEGSKKWLRYVLNQGSEKKGQSKSIIATVTDVSGRKQAEASTLESELKFLGLVEGAFLGILVTRKDRTLFANQAYANLMEYSDPGELALLPTSSEMIHEEDRFEVVEYIKKFAGKKSAPDRFVHRLIRKNGEPIWVEVFPSLVNWEGRTAIQCAFHDITDRMRVEHALRESEERYRTLVESSLFGIIVHVDGLVVFSNQSMASMLGYDSTEQALKTFGTNKPLPHLKTGQRRVVIDNLNRIQAGEIPGLQNEFDLKTKDGSPLAFRFQSRRILWDGRPAVLSTVLDITESKRLETEFEEQHKLLETIFDIIPIILYTKDRDRRMTYLNRAFAEQYDLDPREVIGKRSEDFSYRTSEEVALLRETDNRVMETGERLDLSDYTLTLPNGDVRYREGSKIPLRNAKGEVVGLVGMSIDVTDRVNSERILRESEARFRAIVESLPYSVAIVDQETARYAFVNEAFRTIFGIGDPIEEHHAVEFYVDPKDRDSVMEEIRKFGGYGPREIAYRSTDGKPFWALGSGKGIIYDGRPCYLNSFADITDKREAETKLRKSEALLRAVFDALPLRIFVKDTEGKFIMVNPAAAEFIDFPMERLGNFINEDMYWLNKEILKRINDEDERILNTGERIEEYGQNMVLVDGREYIGNSIKAPILDEESNVLGLVVVIQDVTELWKAREEVDKKQALLEAVFDALPLFMSVKDTQGRFLMVNRAAAEFLNFPLDRLGTFSNEDIYWRDESGRRMIIAEDERVLQNLERITEFEQPLKLPDGREIIANRTKVPIIDEEGKILGLIAVHHDVTELWNAREEARGKQALLEAVFDALPLFMAVKDTQGRYIMMNRAEVELLDFPTDRLGAFRNEDIYWLDKSRLRALIAEDERVLEHGERIETFAVHTRLKDGREIICNTIKAPITDEKGNILGLVVVNHEVTELLRVRKEAQEKQALLETVFDALPLWVIVKDKERRFVLANREMAEEVGFPLHRLGEFRNEDIYWLSESDHRAVVASDEEIIRTGIRIDNPDAVYHRQDGKIVHLHSIRVPIVAESGEITGLVSVALDITEQKEMELQLRKSEELLRSVVNNIPVVLWALDLEGRITLSEGKGLLAQGLQPGEVVGKSVFDLYRDYPEFLANVRRAMNGDSVVAVNETRGAFYERMMAPMRNEDGAVAGLIGVSLDITKRHRAEMALRGSEERYRALVEGSVQGIIVYDLKDYRALFANESMVKESVYNSLEEAMEEEVFLFDTIMEPYARPLKDKLEQMAEGSLKQFQTEIFITRKRKTKPNFWAEVIARRIDWDGIPAVQFTVMDITDRKRAEEAMKDQQALLTKQNEYFQQDISRRRERHQKGIIAESQAMRHVLREAELVAKANIPILIEGETGTGKEIVAEYIHRQSDRSKHLLSIVNCGALTENLMDAELFGHERGAFTGAGDARAGLIEIADHGTLFLDEIGDIPASAQVRLLRFLEQGMIRRVGSNREKKVDVRILAATHKTLKEQVAEGTFREDLYHRLLVIRIVVPPLRDRLEDIIPFSQKFLEEACVDAHIDPKTFGEDARLALTRYEWPGNVRELSHTVQRAVFSAQLEGSNTIRPEHLDLPLPASADEVTLPVKEVKKRAERQHAHAVLRHFNGNRRKASESMGISERQLYRILD